MESESIITIPVYLKNKILPINNKNPVYKLANIYDICRFGDITLDLLKEIYDEKRTFFWAVVKQLAFHGVLFKGNLSKYNLVNDNMSKLLWSNNKDEFLDYDLINSNYLKRQLISYGLIKKRDINGIFLEVIIRIMKEYTCLKQFINKQEIDIITRNNFPSDNCYSLETKNEIFSEAQENIYCSTLMIKQMQKKDVRKILLAVLDSKTKMIIKDLQEKLKIVGINISLNKIRDFINNISSLRWSDFQEESVLTLASYIKKLVLKNNINLNNLYDEFNLNHNNNNKFYLLYTLNKLSSINIDKKGYFYLSDRNNNNFKFYYILELLSLIDEKNLNELIRNLFLNENQPLKLEVIHDKLSYIKNKLSKQEVEITLRKEKSFKLIGPDMWSLSTWDYNTFNEDFVLTVTNILRKKYNERNVDIIKTRLLQDITLEEIGETFNLSRERVRQIENDGIKSLKHPTNFPYLKPYFAIINKILEKNIIVKINQFSNINKKYFSSINIDALINLYNQFNKKQIYKIKDKYISLKSINFFEKHINNILNNNADSINLDEFIFLIQKRKICNNREEVLDVIDMLKDIYYSYEYNTIVKAQSKTEMEDIVLKEFFPNGISLSKNMNKIRQYLYSLFPCVFNEDTDRNIISKLSRECNTILNWGHGKYIHVYNVKVSRKDLLDIVEWIKHKLSYLPEILVNKVFKEFKNYLLNKNVPNKYALYSLLKLYFKNDFYYYRFPRILPTSAQGNNIDDNVDILKNYILNKKQIVDKQELEDFFVKKIGWEDYTLVDNINKNNDIVSVDYNKFVHINNININKKSLDEVLNWIISVLKDDKKLITINKIFKENIVKMKMSNINNPRMLYHCLKYYYPNKFIFNYPIISLEEDYDSNIMDLVENYFLEAKGSVFVDELEKDFSDKGIKPRHLYHARYYNNNIIPLINHKE